MRVTVVCQSRSHALLLTQALGVPVEELTFVVESTALERSMKKLGCEVIKGPFRDKSVYRESLPASLLVIILRDQRRVRTILEAVRKERGETPVLVLSLGPVDALRLRTEDYPWAHFMPVAERFEPSLRTDTRLARSKLRVRQLREILGPAKSVLVLLQDDPDPDGLACGLALRALLGRKRNSMPMGSFGEVTRPENLEMMRVLDIELVPVTEESLASYDRIVMVDTQPPHLRVCPPNVDVVIDHHPAQTSYEARLKDVRNAYGATATILVEYLRAEGTKVNERLATALLYAVRTDTLLLERPVCEADIEAFTWLFTRANMNWIRRIERPALPRETLGAFADGLKQARIEDKAIISHLGPVGREDIIPQLADFCLQVEGADWSAVSGVFNGELIISVRNVGFDQKAGGVVKSAFGDIGSAGGHRSMAKALIPVDALPREPDGELGEEAYKMIEDRFLAAIRGDEPE
jgi:nanoRNase/pAp phosphatase (c-di-AMP/oligoRNAs hydrolase)